MDFLGFFALAIALAGLVLVSFEIVLKAPSAFLEMAQDAGRFARQPVLRAEPTPVRPAAAIPANDHGGLRAA